MIISCSRRTDIPAFYSKWFFNRVREGFVQTRNPFNPKQISTISLKPGNVDCFVFWSKNPAPMLSRLNELESYSYYFQFTLNGYGGDIERNLPPVETLIETFKELSKKIGKDRVIWRYDPVLLSPKYTKEFHIDNFEYLASKLGAYTNRSVFSFIDLYKKISKKMESLEIREPDSSEMMDIARSFKGICNRYSLDLRTCGEAIDLRSLGIEKSSCIDGDLIRSITGRDLNFKRDSSQRGECLCVKSRDIGVYNSCLHNCVYCYANSKIEGVRENIKKHDNLSNFLIG